MKYFSCPAFFFRAHTFHKLKIKIVSFFYVIGRDRKIKECLHIRDEIVSNEIIVIASILDDKGNCSLLTALKFYMYFKTKR